jgi:hypothetical protein
MTIKTIQHMREIEDRLLMINFNQRGKKFYEAGDKYIMRRKTYTILVGNPEFKTTSRCRHR